MDCFKYKPIELAEAEAKAKLVFPDIFAFARRLVGEKASALTCIEFLAKKALVLGDGIPRGSSKLPYLTNTNERLDTLLKHSMRVQSARLPSTEISHFIVANASMASVAFMHHYLKHLGIESSRVVGSRMDFLGRSAFHTWLRVDGVDIETAFFFNESKEVEALYFELGCDYKYIEGTVPPHEMSKARKYFKPENFEKAVVFSMKIYNYVLNPMLKMYDISMREIVKNLSGSYPILLEDKWAALCWGCMKSAEEAELKTCTKCEIARYCSKECQRADWKINHKMQHAMTHPDTFDD